MKCKILCTLCSINSPICSLKSKCYRLDSLFNYKIKRKILLECDMVKFKINHRNLWELDTWSIPNFLQNKWLYFFMYLCKITWSCIKITSSIYTSNIPYITMTSNKLYYNRDFNLQSVYIHILYLKFFIANGKETQHHFWKSYLLLVICKHGKNTNPLSSIKNRNHRMCTQSLHKDGISNHDKV